MRTLSQVGFVFLATALLTVGCEAPVKYQGEENDTYFVVNGFLDTRADTQFVRVEPVRPTPARPESLDARVTTTRRYDPHPVAWTDSLVRLDDGSTGHLFYAPLSVSPGSRYYLTVHRSDGAATRASIRVPPPHRLKRISTDNTLGATVAWVNLDHRPYQIQMCYRVGRARSETPQVVRLDYRQSGRRGPPGWRVVLKLTEDRAGVREALGAPPGTTLWLHDLGMTVTERSPNWQSDDERDRNIENGLGFFGAVTRSADAIALPRAIARRYGYRRPDTTSAYPSCARQESAFSTSDRDQAAPATAPR